MESKSVTLKNNLVTTFLGGSFFACLPVFAREPLTTAPVGAREEAVQTGDGASGRLAIQEVDQTLDSLLGVRNLIEEAKRGKELASAIQAVSKLQEEALDAKAKAALLPLRSVDELGNTSVLSGFDTLGLPIILRDSSNIQAQQSGTSALWPTGISGYDLTGAGRNLGLWDVSGVPRLTHEDFSNTGLSRIANQPGQAAIIGSHATKVAGVMAGGGTMINPANPLDSSSGMAFEATINSWDMTGGVSDAQEMSQLPIDRLQSTNHSYGLSAGWEPVKYNVKAQVYRTLKTWVGDLKISTTEPYQFGKYDLSSDTMDAVCAELAWTLPVFTVGNDRDDAPGTMDSATYVKVVKGFSNQGSDYFVSYYDGNMGLYNGSKFWRFDGGTWNTGVTPPVYKPLGPAIILSGASVADGGALGYDSIPSGGATAKNVLTIGTVTASGMPAPFSSFGPTDDGRIKPDVLAGGENVFTADADADDDYSDPSTTFGTSFSAPVVCGSIGLLTELQENLWGNKEPLRSSTYRALTIHSAADLGSTGPDYATGWGRADFTSAADIVAANHSSSQRTHIKEIYIQEGQESNFTIKAAGGVPVKVTLAWTDPYTESYTAGLNVLDYDAATLVNNLDLRVFCLNADGSNGPEYFPWILDPSSPSALAVTGQNDRDNVEQVETPQANTGSLYRVNVKQKPGTTIANGVQPASLILSGVVNRSIPFSITGSSYVFSGGNVTATLTWGAHAGEYYKIEYSSNLLNWVECSGAVPAGRDSCTAISTPVPSSPPKYFRVKTVAPNPFNY